MKQQVPHGPSERAPEPTHKNPVLKPDIMFQKAQIDLVKALDNSNIAIALAPEKVYGIIHWENLPQEVKDRQRQWEKDGVSPGTVTNVPLAAAKEQERRHPGKVGAMADADRNTELAQIEKEMMQKTVGVRDISALPAEEKARYFNVAHKGVVLGLVTTMDYLVEKGMEAKHPGASLADLMSSKEFDEERVKLRKEITARCKTGRVVRDIAEMKPEERDRFLGGLRSGHIPFVMHDKTKIYTDAFGARDQALEALEVIATNAGGEAALAKMMEEAEKSGNAERIDNLRALIASNRGQKLLEEAGVEK